MVKRLAVLAALLGGLWCGVAMAADVVRVETAGGRVLQGRLVGNTARDLLIEIPGQRQPIGVARADIRRFAVVGPDRPSAPPRPLERLPAPDRTGTLRMSGANAMGALLLPALLLDYGKEAGLVGAQEEMTTDPAARVFMMQGAESTRKLRVQVVSHGSANGMAELLAGQADIAMSSRPATEAELRAMQLAAGAQRADVAHVVALGGVVMIVHRDNPVRALSAAQLRDLLSGATTRWSAVGGGAVPVSVYALDRRSGDYDIVQERILGPGTRLAPNARLYESHEDLADAVAADPGAIGFVGVAHVGNARALRLQQDCGPSGEPNAFNLKAEEYPLSRRLYLYNTTRASPLARDIIGYATSARGQGVVATSGFVNLDPVLADAEASAAQLAAAGRGLPDDMAQTAAPLVAGLRQMLAGARRLSVTFRFDGGRADLDARAEADLGRLAAWLRGPGASGSVILVGHASLDGVFTANVELSRARAQSVADRLRHMGVDVTQVDGVGPADQIVCGLGAADGDLNRRVEVWVR